MGASIYARLVHEEDLPQIDAVNRQARLLEDGQVIDARYRLLHANGSRATFDRRVTPFQRSEDGTVRQVLVLARDVSNSVRLEDELRAAALHDPLTGLPNRRLLTDRLDSALRRTLRAGQEIAVLFVDLDGFKGVNDSGGHEVGDDVLVVTAGRLSSAVRSYDTVARVGGDEFVVLLEPGFNEPAVLDAAEMRARAEAVSARLVKALAMPVRSGDRMYGVTASIGLAFAVPGATSDVVLKNADEAMYSAKSSGKNRGVTARC